MVQMSNFLRTSSFDGIILILKAKKKKGHFHNNSVAQCLATVSISSLRKWPALISEAVFSPEESPSLRKRKREGGLNGVKNLLKKKKKKNISEVGYNTPGGV